MSSFVYDFIDSISIVDMFLQRDVCLRMTAVVKETDCTRFVTMPMDVRARLTPVAEGKFYF